MAVITSYSTLLTEIASWLARSDLTAAIPGFVQDWEEEFYNDSENWGSWMEAALSVTIASNVAAVPADYLGLRVAYISGNTGALLKRINLEQLYARYPRDSGVTGTPKYIARNRTNFEFGPIPSSGTLAGTYYAKPTVLRSDVDGVNWLITNAPHLCLAGSMVEALLYLKDESRLSFWQAKYDKALNAYRAQMRGEDFSGNPPHIVAV